MNFLDSVLYHFGVVTPSVPPENVGREQGAAEEGAGLPDLPSHRSIDISVSGRYFSISATGYSVDGISQNPGILAEIFDPSSNIDIFTELLYGFVSLRPIVWFSEFCLVDISTSHELFRQSFMHGSPISQIIRLPLEDMSPTIGVMFTLSHDRFANTYLEASRLRRVLRLWKNSYRSVASRGYAVLHFDTYWKEQSRTHFMVRMAPKSPLKEEKGSALEELP